MSQVVAPAGGMSFASEIAVLLLENEANHAESSQAARDAAREEFLTRANEQVEALHAAADATKWGAVVSGGLSAVGGVCQIAGAVDNCDAEIAKVGKGRPLEVAEQTKLGSIYTALGNTSNAFAEPLKTWVFDSTAMHREADAKHAETLAEQARWQAQDANSEIEKADRQANKVLDSLQSLNEAQNAANNALLGRI